MRLKSFGCSFIFGTELKDSTQEIPPTASNNTWPALIAKHMGLDYCCYAHGGSGNLAILDRLLNEIASDQPTFFIVGWTYIDRFDYRDVNGGPTGRNDWLALRPYSDCSLSANYYKNLHSEYRDKLTSLMCVNTALSMFNTHPHHKFFMTYMDNLLLDQQYHTSKGIIKLQENIKPYLYNFDGMNFLDWSRQQAFDISDNNHPLESAHASAAKYILSKYSTQFNQGLE